MVSLVVSCCNGEGRVKVKCQRGSQFGECWWWGERQTVDVDDPNPVKGWFDGFTDNKVSEQFPMAQLRDIAIYRDFFFSIVVQR